MPISPLIKNATPKWKHDIDTGNTEPIKQHLYRIAPAYREWVKEEIE